MKALVDTWRPKSQQYSTMYTGVEILTGETSGRASASRRWVWTGDSSLSTGPVVSAAWTKPKMGVSTNYRGPS